jgi:hypothetical protein
VSEGIIYQVAKFLLSVKKIYLLFEVPLDLKTLGTE